MKTIPWIFLILYGIGAAALIVFMAVKVTIMILSNL
jgi:hypothetical protein